MRRLRLEFPALLTLLVLGTGAARFAHQALEHHTSSCSSSGAHRHGHDHHDPSPHETPEKPGHGGCATCDFLAAFAAVPVTAAVAAGAPAPDARPAPPRDAAPRTSRVPRELSGRPPPRFMT